MSADIILIGPIGVGKSTVGKLLAERLDLLQTSVDEVRWGYYLEMGYDQDVARQYREAGDFWGLYRYWKPFEIDAVERVLAEYHGVIDFGAGHSVYEDEEMFQRVQRLLDPYQNIILLLPSPDQEESIALLRERNTDMAEGVMGINEHFVRHPSNNILAKRIIYTRGKTPQETCDEILAHLAP